MNSGTVEAPIDVKWEVPTPEHATFSYRPAGPLVRAAAWLIDQLIRIAILVVIALIVSVIGGKSGWGFWLILNFFLSWFYAAAFEALRNGQTPGKKAMGIRVIAQDGGPATGGACVLRHFVLVADMMPAGGLAGMISMICTNGFRRLGDLAAGTLVVYDERGYSRGVPPAIEMGVVELALALPRGLALRFSVEQKRALTGYVKMRPTFHPERRQELAAVIHDVLRSVCHLPPHKSYDADVLLCAVQLVACHPSVDLMALHEQLLLAEKEAAAEAAEAKKGRKASRKKKRSHSRTKASHMAMVGQELSQSNAKGMDVKRDAWKELETLLVMPNGSMKPRDAYKLSMLARHVGADLALADAQHLPDPTIQYLENLVARAHLRLYHGSGGMRDSIVKMLTVTAPRLLYHDNFLRISALVFFGLFFFSIVMGVYNPELGKEVLGEPFMQQMEVMYADPPHGRDPETAATMTGFYIANNIGIAFACFATGIFLGIGSLLTLAYNGIFLGLVFAHMWNAGSPVDGHFYEFVVAHGPFELVGIAMAGAAGFRLGWGFVDTGGLSRLESLQQAGRRCLPVISAAAVMIGFAALIEAFVSPSSLPLWAKYSVAGVSVLLIVLYLGGLGAWFQHRELNE